MKLIEPGCLVMVKTKDYFGFTATALERFPEDDVFKEEFWVLDSAPDGAHYLAATRALMRIDDYQQETTETEQEVTA